MAKIFYARVSTVEQNEDRQITMAKEQGIDVTDDQAFYLDKLKQLHGKFMESLKA